MLDLREKGNGFIQAMGNEGNNGVWTLIMGLERRGNIWVNGKGKNGVPET